MTRDGRCWQIQVDDVLTSMAFHDRRARVVGITDTVVTLAPLGWEPQRYEGEHSGGLLYVPRHVWNRMTCWALSVGKEAA